MDSSAPDIVIEDDGCSYCKAYDRDVPLLPKFQPDASQRLDALIETIRKRGKGHRYDCVIGLSGGVDSSYVAYLCVKQFGLRTLAVHMDNGWNDELAVHNIEKIVRKLGLDLVTEVLDWKEFRALQLAFLKASTPDCEIPTDHAIISTLPRVARRLNVPTICFGTNRVTEYIMPPAWSQGHADWKYIKTVARRFSNRPLRSFPHTNLPTLLWQKWGSSVRPVDLLSYIHFDKVEVEKFICREFGWRPYGGKHYESIYTRFFQGYLLPAKFGYDKRRAHLSNLIVAGQLTRDAALRILQSPPLYEDEAAELLDYVADKFDISPEQLRDIIAQPPRRFEDYPSRYNCIEYRAVRMVYRCTLKPVLSALGVRLDTV
jgi:N-acetyl sugar amidotransferase